MIPAVQHERARRPVLGGQQYPLQKIGYAYRHPGFLTHAPIAVPTFPSLHSYSPQSALENFQEFPRFPDSLPPDIQLGTLVNSSAGAISSLNPFKIPLFPTSLHYPTHTGYFSNILYPPLATENTDLRLDTTCSECIQFYYTLSRL